MFKKILLGVDGSEDAMKAVNRVLEMTKEDNSEVVLFHSVLHRVKDMKFSLGTNISMGSNLSYEIHRDQVKAANELLKKIKDMFSKEGKNVETRLIYEHGPQYYIEEQVKKEGFDLVVLGCKGEHTKLKRTIIGTVPEYVINHANTDILIVK
ncbi:MAG: universal stress protein [Candidatus Lokiarchaeota archaeon]|nr:universal stress protein [Candidatus Lokiarchaeota archaeon]